MLDQLMSQTEEVELMAVIVMNIKQIMQLMLNKNQLDMVEIK